MIVTVTQYKTIHKTHNNEGLPIGGERCGHQKRASAGSFDALGEGCRFVRVATDTSITVDVDGADLFLPAGGIEFFAAKEGDQITVATV